MGKKVSFSYIVSLSVLIILLLAMAGCEEADNATTDPLSDAQKDVQSEIKEQEVTEPAPPKQPLLSPLEIHSPKFKNKEKIPSEYTCDGENIIPPLVLSGHMGLMKSFALIMDDPDAPSGTFVHWVLWNIPPTPMLDETMIPEGTMQGKNGRGEIGYTGPCPPSGEHRYFFKLYALDTTLDLAEGASKKDLLNAMDGHVVGQAELVGLYSRG